MKREKIKINSLTNKINYGAFPLKIEREKVRKIMERMKINFYFKKSVTFTNQTNKQGLVAASFCGSAVAAYYFKKGGCCFFV